MLQIFCNLCLRFQFGVFTISLLQCIRIFTVAHKMEVNPHTHRWKGIFRDWTKAREMRWQIHWFKWAVGQALKHHTTSDLKTISVLSRLRASSTPWWHFKALFIKITWQICQHLSSHYFLKRNSCKWIEKNGNSWRCQRKKADARNSTWLNIFVEVSWFPGGLRKKAGCWKGIELTIM